MHREKLVRPLARIGGFAPIDPVLSTSPTVVSAPPITMRSPGVVAIGLGLVLFNIAAAMLAIQERWPAAFGMTPDPDHVARDAVIVGTAISAPVAPLVALIAFILLAQARARSARIVGYLGTIVVALLFVVGTVGEPTLVHPESALEEAIHLLGLALATVLLVVGVRGLAGLRSRR